MFSCVCRQHAVGINNSETLASKETGPFIATNGFIFVYDGRKKDAPLSIHAAENAEGNRTADMKYGIYIMHKARYASECMINKKSKRRAGGWGGAAVWSR